MKEIEVEVAFKNTKEEAIEILSKFNYVGEKELKDIYYYDPLRKNLKPESDLRLNETFRVRSTKDKTFVTYKKQHFKGKLWIYSDEYETEVKDSKIIETIVSMLGLVPLITVHNRRRIYRTEDYEIELEDVEGLGLFLEVEKLKQVKDDDEMSGKEEIRDFIRSLKLNNVRELNIGKNQYLLSIAMEHPLKIFNDTDYN